MKKLASVSVIVTFVMLSILPVLALIGKILGYEYEFNYRGIIETVICVVTIAASVIALKAKNIKLGVGYRILCGLLFPMGILTWFFMMAHAPAIYSVFAAPCIFFCAAVCAKRFLRITVIKYLIIGCAGIVFMLSCFMYVLSDVTRDLAGKEIIYTELSPDGRYRAELEEKSMLMDGQVILYIYDTEEDCNLGIVKYFKTPEKADEDDYHKFFDFYGSLDRFSLTWKEKDGKMSAEFYRGEEVRMKYPVPNENTAGD